MNYYDNYEMKFDRKGYGRIFVEKESDVAALEDIIKEIDPYEFEWYYPTGNYMGGNNERLVTTYSDENFKSIYVGKFDDMNMVKVLKRAWDEGIHCFVVFGKINQFDGG
jgi:hypothetical protein